jgi:hypothetical protein
MRVAQFADADPGTSPAMATLIDHGTGESEQPDGLHRVLDGDVLLERPWTHVRSACSVKRFAAANGHLKLQWARRAQRAFFRGGL